MFDGFDSTSSSGGDTTSLVSSASSAIPVIGQALSLLGSILGAEHQAAVAAEANDLNQAVPNYRKNLLAIVNAFNSGQIDSATAQQAVDEAITEYYSAVSGIISSGRGPSNCSNLSSNCNGPCTVGCDWIVPWGRKTQSAIQLGNATVSFDAIPAHAGFNGLPAWSLIVARSTVGLLTNNAALNGSPVSTPISNPASVLSSLTGSAGVASITPTPITSSLIPRMGSINSSVLPASNKILLLGMLLAVIAVLALLFGKSE